MARDSALDRLKDNLLRLEVNTILKDEMTAAPMPVLPHALLDLADNYVARIAEYGVPVQLAFIGKEVDETVLLTQFSADAAVAAAQDVKPEEPRVDIDTFDRIRWAAKMGAVDANPNRVSDPERRLILNRIKANCDALKVILKRSGAKEAGGPTRSELVGSAKDVRDLLSVSRDDYATIQKIWEIGTEQVALQTAITLAGDVNTRVRRSLAPAELAPLLDIHKASVAVSVESWRHLVATAIDLLQSLFGAVGRKLRPMTQVIGEQLAVDASRAGLGQLLCHRRIDIVSQLVGRCRPFARTTLSLGGDVTTMVCRRRCPSRQDCDCGLTGHADRWSVLLPLHRRRLETDGVSAFRKAARLAGAIRVWLPIAGGVIAFLPAIRSTAWTGWLYPIIAIVLVRLVGQLALTGTIWRLRRHAARTSGDA